MGKRVEMIGKKFGRWEVIAETNERTYEGAIKWLCRCECGTIKAVPGTALRNGSSKSCGCYNHEIISQGKHKYKTKLYAVWNSMKNRCRCKTDKAYHNYGGRGIGYTEEWNDFDKFEEWALSNGYKQGLWLDRIDNDKDYSPANCRWTTPKVQQNNKRTNVTLCIDGITKTVMEWADESGIPYPTIRRRMELGWEETELLKPIDKRYSHGEAIRAYYR